MKKHSVSGKKNQHPQYGGAYVPEMLHEPLRELVETFEKAQRSAQFRKEYAQLLKHFSGRPTPLTFAAQATKHCKGARIYLKNEGLNITGAHKITHCLGQALIARTLGKTTLIAETGAGQHGVATATVAAKLGMKCVVFMGAEDIRRQRPNVFFMELMGARVISVESGSKTLKDAVNEALKYWMEHLADAHYVIGSVLGPKPYPEMNRYFQSIIGREIQSQLKEHTGATLPAAVIACVGGGSNAIGAFDAFIPHTKVRLIGVEAGGRGNAVGEHSSRKIAGEPGIFQGYKSLFLQTKDGQIAPTHSIAAGLDYPGLGPDLAMLYEAKRLELTTATDTEALAAVEFFARNEGIIPALESAHALAYALKLAPTLSKTKTIVVNVSGRGDKDLFTLAREHGDGTFKAFLADELSRY
jgi:tryptophan synthase beta chain